MRSKLFVPASRPELLAKAIASAADAISIDLEDSVVADRKAQARAHVSEFLDSEQARTCGQALIVRVNGLTTPHFEADAQAVLRPGLSLLNVPKIESPDDVRAAAALMERIEAANGIREPIGILANIETPKGVRFAADIAAAHPRVAGLQLGYADLFEPFGIDRRDRANVHAVMYSIRMAAAAANVFAYDGAFADVRDSEGFRAEAQMARRLGFWGKSCIHPAQIPIANEVFDPAAADVDHAQRVLEASRRAEAAGAGAFLLDGRMVDAPMIRRAEAIVAMSSRSRRSRER